MASSAVIAQPLPLATGTARPVICQLVHNLNVGGAEILARRFAEQARDEFDFVFACLDSPGAMATELADAGYRIEALGRRPGFDWGCARRLLNVCRKHRVQLVHAHQYAPFFYASLARLVSWRTFPIVFTEHGRDYPDYRRPKRVWANRLLLRSSDRVIAVGECVRQALVDNEGLPANHVQVVYNGIDVAAYDDCDFDRAQVRRSLDLAAGDIAIIQVARCNPLKDHSTAIRALACLAASHPHVRLLVVGDGEQRGKIESIIAELGLAHRVRMLGTRRDVAQLLAAADIFLLSSISEGVPLTLLEAMAAGLPCVSTAVGGTPEVILDGQTGLLARAGDPADVAQKLRTLIDNAELRHSLGAAGRLRSQECFSDADMHLAYRKIYRQLLPHRSVARAHPVS
jgi:glycosyltransferase involved in cell wall biosynthesis